MRILLFSNLYAPEPTGIGPYSSDLATALFHRGHEVTVIAANPSYPHWKLFEGFSAWSWSRDEEDGVVVHRVPVYIPAKVGGLKRILHYASFSITAIPTALALARRFRPEIVVAVVPTLLIAPLARLTASISGAASLLHVQDFEIEAGFATGQMNSHGILARAALAFESRSIAAFDAASSISPEMCAKLIKKGKDPSEVYQLRNWADIDAVKPQSSETSIYREIWDIKTPHVALYSGSIAKKQGIEILVEIAHRFKDNDQITFVICGDGPTRAALEASAVDLPNIQFHGLQPRKRLGDLLGLATIHLLPESLGSSDLVLPSKLTNMLASGKPIVSNAIKGSGLAREIFGCGLIAESGDSFAMASCIEQLMCNETLYHELAANARFYAEDRWSRDGIIDRFEEVLTGMYRENSSRRDAREIRNA